MSTRTGSVTFGESETTLDDDDDAATPQETRETYLSRGKSGYTKVRHALIQVPGTARKGSQPGLLSGFSRNHRALVLYLALLANWPWLSREKEPLPAGAWLRFLQSDDPKALTWTPQSLSHAWKVLEDLGLIVRPRKGRLIDVQPRREDAGSVYISPTGLNQDLYMTLPNEFWTEQLHGSLSWSALAVLLVLLKETGGKKSAPLAIDRAQDWYGVSRTTAEQGLTELRELGFLISRDRRIKDANSAEGRRLTSEHTLLGVFSTEVRADLRAKAKERVDKRDVAERANKKAVKRGRPASAKAKG